ncbi:MAG: acyltransferase family protein, partial [Pseudomonadota bacterium]|nr:acyltransferase family protein [Pseudomonadota bacterium]
MKRQHLYGLDLVRFGSAFLVLLFHLSTFSKISPTHVAAADERAFDWLGWVGVSGWVGVEVFFVISGFVIAASAENSNARDFIIKRGIRVFPALWICSLIALSVSLAWGMPTGEALNAFVRSALLSPQGPYIDGVVWTLVLEAVFYVYVAFLILLGGRVGRPLLNVGGLLLGAGSVAFITAYMAAAAAGLGVTDTLLRFPFKVALLWHGVFFALGMLIRKAAKEGLTPIEMAASAVFTVFCLIEIVNNVLVGTGSFGTEAYRISLAVG